MKSREGNIFGLESLVEQWTYFNEKYIRGNNLPPIFIKGRYMKNDTFF